MKVENSDDLARLLVEKWDYVPSQAPDIAKKLLGLYPDIRAAFETWLDTGEFSDTPVYSGLSPRSLNHMVRLKPPAVFLLLDWIRREPSEAMQAIHEELV